MPSSLAISVTYLLLLLSLASAVSAQIWKAGHATRYGPYASNPAESEQGYLPNEVGVGCSTGIVGNDPRWNAIVAGGTYTNPTNPNTVWPKRPTVAVSEAAYPSKSRICYKTLKIRASGVKNAPIIDADVVDFCPAAKCNWPRKELAFNVDVYGEYTWKALGGKDGGGKLKVEIAWPADVTPAPIPDGIGAPETPVTVDPTDAPTQPLDGEFVLSRWT
ncbi:uncharacterized protein EV422DRAFT_3845 [Fimicolochytrium jonesii]|uniref:uncharacterized protein n=1 Tax=Fimicolochytrium jonesii TaxID=1396493 RepID=UPI0022FF145D|nr:uncharacterized protein EV422DRAFT_3845 [Fimicolochytrium jonesii]KAI8826611.1 hypothetical protein EV422DRAFT_3845 [Fimicolochytrium jonesii]